MTPLLSVVITPRTPDDSARLSRGLATRAAEDPTIRVTILDTGDAVVGGMGEVHLAVVADRVMGEFNVAATVSALKVIYKETVTRDSEGEGRYVSQQGGRGQYAHAKIRLLPGRRGSGYTFTNEIAGSPILPEFIQPIDEGIQDALARGVLAGFQVDDVRVVLYDGSYHDGDSSPASFRIAGAMAFGDAAKRAHPVLLEPVMHVEVFMPMLHAADTMETLAARRAWDVDTGGEGGVMRIQARAPLARLLGLTSELREQTQGLARCTLTLSGYEPVDPGDATEAASGVRLGPRPTPRPSGISLTEPRDEA